MAKFIDEIEILLKAGKGGDGMISFRREAHVDKGGPDGGDGGNGGNIYFIGDKGKNTLLFLSSVNKITAKDGIKGGPKNLYGANGESTYIKVPIGTMVFKNNELIADVIEENKPYLVATGGKGGRGNMKFKSAKNTAPKICENGLPGETYKAKIILKILSDIGIVGKPCAGKSTLLNALSNAKAKIGDYEFTTLVPQLGIVKYFENVFTIADLPGLIQGASQGKGLGIQFLKHIERCKIIAHIIDFGSIENNPINNYEEIQNELKNVNLKLEKKKQIIIANKKDLPNFKKNYQAFIIKYPNLKIISISALNADNLEILKKEMWQEIKNLELEPIENLEPEKIQKIITLEKEFEITKIKNNTFELKGERITYFYNRIPFTTYDNILRFNNILKKIGVWDELIKKGIKTGDIVKVFNYEFIWEYD